MSIKNLHTLWIIAYGIMLVVGSIMALVNKQPIATYIFGTGAVLAIAQTFTYAMQNKTDDITQSRIMRLNFIATLFLGIGAWFMYKGGNEWVVMLLIYVVISLYLSFRSK